MAAIGECMLELSGLPQSGDKCTLQLGFGGDTLNTALYAARLGVSTHYVTALGDDPRSQWLIRQWHKEEINTDWVFELADRQPGLYWITTDSAGERSFAYWRGEAAARELFDNAERAAALTEALATVGLVYLSGITLSLYAPESLERFWTMLETLKERGVIVAFDGNYRPRGWLSPEDAQSAFLRAASLCHIALPTFEDEVMLFGDASEEATIDRWLSLGAQELVLKRGERGCVVATREQQTSVPIPSSVAVIDTTAAGDSFNAAYLSGRLAGHTPVVAANFGNRLAGSVIAHRGAVIPKSAMPVFDLWSGDSS